MKKQLKVRRTFLNQVISWLVVLVFSCALLPAGQPANAEQACTEGVLRNLGVAMLECGSYCGPTTSVSVLPDTVPDVWGEILTNAAEEKQSNAQLLAALYLTSNNNEWLPIDHQWTASPDGSVAGPFRIPNSLWDGYKTDGNNDGVVRVESAWDSAFTAAAALAAMGVAKNTPTGTLQTPVSQKTLLSGALKYFVGPGTVEQIAEGTSLTDAIAPGAVGAPFAGQINNILSLLSFNFARGGEGYATPHVAAGVEDATTETTSDADNGNAPTIVLDPGHSDPGKSVIDPATGLTDNEYSNYPGSNEILDAFDVAVMVEENLTDSGYTVVKTKGRARGDYVGLRNRADIAVNSHADLAVSIHTDPSNGLKFKDAGGALVFPQRVGAARYVQSTGAAVTFDNAETAALSQQYTSIFVQERTRVEGHQFREATANLDDRGPGFSGGNIWLVQLFAQTIPWVYNEVGGDSDPNDGFVGLNDADKRMYADGLIASIKKAVPLDGSNNRSCAQGRDAIVQEAVRLAWDHKVPNGNAWDGRFYERAKPEYQTGLIDNRARLTKDEYGWHVDSKKYDGHDEAYSDCGVFVASVVLGTGVDPDWPNRGTYNSHPYVTGNDWWYNRESQFVGGHGRAKQTKWEVHDDITDTSMLKPGDILVWDDDVYDSSTGEYREGPGGHTFIFVGPQPGPDGQLGTGDDYSAVGASFHSRVPQVHPVYLDVGSGDNDGNGRFTIARLY